ncbi:Glu-tRNA(Gln) amidotransferase subunit GatD [Candidatus Zixiibacteriota bacterium]
MNVGDRIILQTPRGPYEGIIMPRTEHGDGYHIVMKLVNGYNVGIRITGTETIENLESSQDVGVYKGREPIFDESKPTFSILHTGGTIASRVDYKTGGVVPAFTPEEILELFPELEEVGNFRAYLVSNMFSEDIEYEHVVSLARGIEKELELGTTGVVITHGTDTMHISSAALSFIAQKLPVPAIFVGSQRSSDRGSSDAKMNLMSAARFATGADFAGVGLCMHESMEDDACFIHEGTKVKKMHSSRRDSFRSINQVPFARVWQDGRVAWLREDHARRDLDRTPEFYFEFEEKVALVKSYPGFQAEIIRYLTNTGYRGIVFEGTGLGHVPLNVLDEYTAHHSEILKAITEFVENGGTAVMTSASLFGRVSMNVYSTGRYLQSAGVIPGEDMMSEVALVKLKWVLGQTTDPKEAAEMMITNYAGEIAERTTSNVFYYQLPRTDRETAHKWNTTDTGPPVDDIDTASEDIIPDDDTPAISNPGSE